jgi:hypothetical protein
MDRPRNEYELTSNSEFHAEHNQLKNNNKTKRYCKASLVALATINPWDTPPPAK